MQAHLYRLLCKRSPRFEHWFGEGARQIGMAAWSWLGAASFDDLRVRSELSRSVTVLTTDLVNFSGLVERLGDVAARLVIQRHNRVLRACLRRFRGREAAHTGDGIIASFARAHDGIACALSIQEQLRHLREHTPATNSLHARIGLHAGIALPEEGRLFGSAVIVAVRVCSVTPADAVFVSRSVREAAENAYLYDDIGLVRLKGFTEPKQLFAVTHLH